MIGRKEKNGCVMLVKGFIDIPPYVNGIGGAGIPGVQGYDCTVMIWSPEYAAEWWRYPEMIE